MYEYTSIIYLASAYTLLDILQLYSKQRCLIKPRDIDAACDWWLPPRVRDLLTGHNARWPQFYYGNMFKEPLVCSCWFISSPSGLFGLVTWNMRVNCNLGYKQFLQHLKKNVVLVQSHLNVKFKGTLNPHIMLKITIHKWKNGADMHVYST